MTDDQDHRGFSITPRDLQIRPRVTNEMMIGLYCRSGGCSYEFALRWYENAGRSDIMRLEMYDEALSALADWPDLMAWLATRSARFEHGRTPCATTVEDVATALGSMGFEDRSMR